MSNELVDQNTREMPELNMEIIKKYICPAATDQEIYTFLQLCKAQRLNPFLREAYLIKYGTSPATIVTGKETFTKRADKLPQYDGFKAGIIVLSNDKILYREGAFYTSAEQVLGGWAEVYCKGKATPYRNEVSIEEYEGKKQDGTPTKMWTEKKGTMIRKVALVQSLREAFPDTFGGQYSPEEINTIETLPVYEIGKAPMIQSPSQVKTPRSKSAQNASPEPTEPGMMIGIANVTMTSGESLDQKTGKMKPWIKYHLKDTNGVDWTTFDKKIADEAKKAKESGGGVIIKTETKGKYTNIVEMKPMTEEPLDPELSKLAEQAATEAGV